MRAAALHSAAGALLLTALSAVPAGGVPSAPGRSTASGVVPGVALAAVRAAARGVDFGSCSDAQDLPGSMQCGTVAVPLDYARPDGKQIKLSVSRVQATHRDPHNSKRRVPRQGALVFNPGGPGGSGRYFPLIGLLPEWKRIGAAYDLVGYDPRGVGKSAPLSCQDPKRFFKGPSPPRSTPPSRTSGSASRRRRRTRRAVGSGRAAPCGTTTRSTTPVTWTCCGPRWARSG